MVARTRTGKAFLRAQGLATQATSRTKQNASLPQLTYASPLLTLPPEIRQMIYFATLAGHTIKPLTPRHPPQKFHCEVLDHDTPREVDRMDEILEPWTNSSDRIVVLGDGDLTTEPSEGAQALAAQKERRKRRKKLWERGVGGIAGLGLGLLVTCKLVEEEAWLVPFRGNYWAFANRPDMEAFIAVVRGDDPGKNREVTGEERERRVQRRERGSRRLAAIRTVLVDDWHEFYWNEWTLGGGLPRRDVFTGLRCVSVMLDDFRREGKGQGKELARRLMYVTKMLARSSLAMRGIEWECDYLVLSEFKLWQEGLEARREAPGELVVRDYWYSSEAQEARTKALVQTQKVRKPGDEDI